jgi:hypothetical protein
MSNFLCVVSGASIIKLIASLLASIFISMQAALSLLYIGKLSFSNVPFSQCRNSVQIIESVSVLFNRQNSNWNNFWIYFLKIPARRSGIQVQGNFWSRSGMLGDNISTSRHKQLSLFWIASNCFSFPVGSNYVVVSSNEFITRL